MAAEWLGWEVVQASEPKSIFDNLEYVVLPELLLRVDPSGITARIGQISIGKLGSVGIEHSEKHRVKQDLQWLLWQACEILTDRNSGIFITMGVV